jgi:hypothetical protein
MIAVAVIADPWEPELEEQIARFMLRAAKFEFYLVNNNMDFAQTKPVGAFEAIAGIQWSKVAQSLQKICPFEGFDFDASPFGVLKRTAPQFLVKGDRRLRWDSDDNPIESWERLLGRSYAQLRNNVAHGNKAQVPAAFTHERTMEFLEAGNALIDFIAVTVCGSLHWEAPIHFQ